MESNLKLPQSVIDAKNQGHEVFSFQEDLGPLFYLRKPTRAELMLFQDKAVMGGGSVSAAQEKFVRILFTGDNAEEFNNYINQKPLAAAKLFDLLVEDMGLNVNFTKTQA